MDISENRVWRRNVFSTWNALADDRLLSPSGGGFLKTLYFSEDRYRVKTGKESVLLIQGSWVNLIEKKTRNMIDEAQPILTIDERMSLLKCLTGWFTDSKSAVPYKYSVKGNDNNTSVSSAFDCRCHMITPPPRTYLSGIFEDCCASCPSCSWCHVSLPQDYSCVSEKGKAVVLGR